MSAPFQTYFDRIKKEKTPAKVNEHTFRTALQNLLEHFAGAKMNVVQEPKAESGLGRPDFMLKNGESIIGYIETKLPGAPLNEVLASEQIKKYQKLSGNIILTDYLEWIWLKNGQIARRETLCDVSDIGKANAKLDKQKAIAVESLLQDFLSAPPAKLGNARELAAALAKRCHQLREFLHDELKRQERSGEKDKLYGLYEAFKSNIFAELKIKEFADAFAQTLGYGLFLAKLNAENKPVTLSNAETHIPGNFQLIVELVGFLKELEKPDYKGIKWLVEEILSIMNDLDLPAIRETLSFSPRPGATRDEAEREMFDKDPYVYFYEDFLNAYDKATRKSRGVYYTPPPAVNFIVRAVNDALKDGKLFGLRDGLATQSRVTVLDFAAGTGTFLLEVARQILEATDKGVHTQIIREHILQNLYGFEYLIAPYTVAHLKLSQFLQDEGNYDIKDGERLRVYLTNTLENIETKMNLLLPALSQEAKEAKAAKEKIILAIIGNPPYSGVSKNNGQWISDKIETYKYVDGKHFGERKHWLNDDYVKFIRFAQHKMENVDEGIVAIITNHAFLDNPTFRGMRQSLMGEFNQLYFFNLHGNVNKREKTPEGGADKNIFDIRQGVAISLMIKKPGIKNGVYYADLWGERAHKYEQLAELDKDSVEWEKLNPTSPFYFFIPRDESNQEEYNEGHRINDIFKENVTGIVTGKDKLTIHYDKAALWGTVQDFAALPPEEARQKYELGEDGRDWKVATAQQDLNTDGPTKKYIKPITYRPFDERVTYYTGRSCGFLSNPRKKVMRHMLAGENLGFSVVRQVKTGKTWQHCLASSQIIESSHISNRTGEIGYFFPLYLYPHANEIGGIGQGRVENFTSEFRESINEYYKHEYPPEDIMGYIYAILHCPEYRKKFFEFLKTDFPRIPFVKDRETFEQFAELGGELLRVHLLQNLPDTPEINAPVSGEWEIKNPDLKGECLYINKTQYFTGISKRVWDFPLGGYKVLHQYLKYRKNRRLTADEISHIKAMVRAINFTIEQMDRIDEIWNLVGELKKQGVISD